MANDSPTSTQEQLIEPGEAVFGRDGRLLGRVTGFTNEGFEVEAVDPDHPNATPLEELPGHEFGEGYLMWRCGVCGEMGELEEGFPEKCPDCGSPKEDIMYWTED